MYEFFRISLERKQKPKMQSTVLNFLVEESSLLYVKNLLYKRLLVVIPLDDGFMLIFTFKTLGFVLLNTLGRSHLHLLSNVSNLNFILSHWRYLNFDVNKQVSWKLCVNGNICNKFENTVFLEKSQNIMNCRSFGDYETVKRLHWCRKPDVFTSYHQLWFSVKHADFLK